MKIIIDADACPVVDITVKTANERGHKCIIVCDNTHSIERDGAETIVVDKGADSADCRIANLTEKGDVIVTQDYGLAALVLGNESGAKIDTVADLVFIIVSFIKILPTINIPKWLWIWGVVIAIIKIANIILGYACKNQFISLHTIMNIVTGFLLFLLPLTISLVDLNCIFIVVCCFATFSAIQEGVYILKKQ